MYDYQNDNMLYEGEQVSLEEAREYKEEFYSMIVKKFKKRNGYKAIAYNQFDNKAELIINGEREEVTFCDIIWKVNNMTCSCSYDKSLQIIIRDESKISLVTNDGVYYWGYNRFPNEIDKLLFYVKTETMEALIYFDITNNVFPIVVYDIADKYLEYDFYMESSEEEVNHSWIENLYNALCSSTKNNKI